MPPLGEDRPQQRQPTSSSSSVQPVLFNDSYSSLHSSLSIGRLNNTRKEDDGLRMSCSNRTVVSFREEVEIVEVLHVQDMTGEEKSQYWWSAEEFNTIMSMADLSIDYYMRGLKENDDADDLFCFRGLEGRSDIAIHFYSQKYYSILNALLQEQHVQKQTGTNNPERLAEVCFQQTQFCMDTALESAMIDEIIAKEYLEASDEDNNNNMKNKSSDR